MPQSFYSRRDVLCLPGRLFLHRRSQLIHAEPSLHRTGPEFTGGEPVPTPRRLLSAPRVSLFRGDEPAVECAQICILIFPHVRHPLRRCAGTTTATKNNNRPRRQKKRKKMLRGKDEGANRFNSQLWTFCLQRCSCDKEFSQRRYSQNPKYC